MKELIKSINFLPKNITKTILKTDNHYLDIVDEIRIKVNSSILLRCKGKQLYISENGSLSYNLTNFLVSFEQLQESFNRLCNFSVYSYIDDIKNGFITLENGSRVGFCGTAVTNGDEIISIKDITSLNIRIARNFPDCSNDIIEKIKENGFGNILIVGSPMSGKTTLLRDLAANLSKLQRIVCVVDERKEITSIGSNNLFDVLLSYPKGKGIQIALRTLSPDYIVTDEISTKEELEAIIDGLNIGVNIALSIHAKDFNELFKKDIYKKMVSVSDFEYVVLLSNKDAGKILEIKSSKDIL